MSDSKIVGLDGQPISSEPGRKFAIVGKINIHYTVFELKPGEDVGHAVRTFNLMAGKGDPKLAEITQTGQLFWAEDDNTRDIGRNTILQQVLAFFTALRPDGSLLKHDDPGAMVDAMLKRVDGDSTTPPPPGPTAA